MIPTGLRKLDLGDRGVAEDRALGDELAALGAHGGDLHRHAGAEARGQAGADLEAEQAAAEQRVVVAAARRSPRPSRRRPAARGPRGRSARETFFAP